MVQLCEAGKEKRWMEQAGGWVGEEKRG